MCCTYTKGVVGVVTVKMLLLSVVPFVQNDKHHLWFF